ncbi:MAG: hypothetical protein IJ493_01695 [Clostridia bacterium]|nr:hypothetical protein [Clostridia bacterium]
MKLTASVWSSYYMELTPEEKKSKAGVLHAAGAVCGSMTRAIERAAEK